uniref:Clathrin/coatomer adaptor adaptin-like N-terminal domain-containing protein n=1 Tax=Panagrolaimus sp. ES5 TaxID=591445 RepID=A0AC34FZH7_9BILA
MLAQKQDPYKLLKIFRACLLKGYDSDVPIKIFKPLILSSLMDDYVAAQKEALRVIAVLAEIKVKHIEKDVVQILIQKFMQSKDTVILSKTLTALAKIISQNSKLRDLAISYNIEDNLF